MKIITLLIASIFLILNGQAQDYKIDFTASGAAAALDSVHVINLTQQTERMLAGTDTLHLYKSGTGIDAKQPASDDLSFYPNPLRNGEGKLSFYQSKSGETEVEIYDVEGKLLLSKQRNLQSGHNAVMFTGLPTGFFMVHVRSATFSSSLKIISIDGEQGVPEIEFVQNVQSKATQTSIKSLMAVKSIIGMQYNDGEPLKFTGYAGSLVSIDTIIPTQSQTVDFHFAPTAAPVADFIASDTLIQIVDTIDFTDQSTNMPTSWSWDFGDGDTSDLQNPVHVYGTAGTFTVSLTVTNNVGSDTETKVDYITVAVAPVADFSVSDTTIPIGDTIDFADQSTNMPTSWSWDFGDGDTSDLQNPAHVYGTAGTFTVSLTATNIAGADTEAKVDYITVTDTTPGIYPSGTVHCISGGADVVDVTNSTTGQTWMDRNLGASQQATSSTDSQAYGDLYQWGRFSDGHQCRNSDTTNTQSNSDTPGHGDFISSGFAYNYDWRSPQNNNLWQGVNGTNNPCPSGYRLPTENELNSERQSWSSSNAAGAYGSPLKLPVAGSRTSSLGSLSNVGANGYYWSSTVDGSFSHYLLFGSSFAYMYSYYRARGYSVRCIKD